MMMTQLDRDLKWESVQWQDGSLYEGLTKDGLPHRSGILQHSNGDRYEGEFQHGHMEGYGVYVHSNGLLHRGQWMRGLAHGCGVRMWKDAARLESTSQPPTGAVMSSSSVNSKQASVRVAEGKFFAGQHVGPIMSCSTETSQQAAVEADVAAALARSFLTTKGKQHRQELAMAKQAPGQAGAGTQQIGQPEVFAAKSQQQPASALHFASLAAQQGHQQTSRQQPEWKLSWPWQRRLDSEDAKIPVKDATSKAGTRNSRANILFSPEGQPLDPEVNFKTRGLRDGERQMVRGLVDRFMAMAAQDHQTHKS